MQSRTAFWVSPCPTHSKEHLRCRSQEQRQGGGEPQVSASVQKVAQQGSVLQSFHTAWHLQLDTQGRATPRSDTQVPRAHGKDGDSWCPSAGYSSFCQSHFQSSTSGNPWSRNASSVNGTSFSSLERKGLKTRHSKPKSALTVRIMKKADMHGAGGEKKLFHSEL